MGKKISPNMIPEPGEGKRGKNGHLGYLLRQAAAGFRQRLDEALSDLNMTPPQFAVLTMISAYPGHSGADLARVALLTPQTLSLIIANLERAGAITRRPHPVHGRIQQLDLSKHGRALLGKARVRVQKLEADILRDLSPREEETIRSWLVGLATKP
jgi:DNA-binding MarR family transcriptional regulator